MNDDPVAWNSIVKLDVVPRPFTLASTVKYRAVEPVQGNPGRQIVIILIAEVTGSESASSDTVTLELVSVTTLFAGGIQPSPHSI
jgi:hypothetical protein